jgi:FkbM family methyltransferase
MAVAHRLAGLEEAATAAEARTALAGRGDSLVQEAAIAAKARTALAGRVNSLVQARDAVSEHVSIGQGNLVIVLSPKWYLMRQHDLIGRPIVDGQEWEPHVRMGIERAARPDGEAVDAGAYVGVHTITMSGCFRTVHTFGPQRGTFQMLCGNLALNGGLNNAALYDRAGSIRLSPQERQEVNAPTCYGPPHYDHIEIAAACHSTSPLMATESARDQA